MKIVLHICCAICTTVAVERLVLEGYKILGLFYNPNIYPSREYDRRLDAAFKVAKELNFQLESAPYKPEEWFQEIKGLEGEPEGGKRCKACFKHRLKRAYLFMKDYGIEFFTTTLTTSPRKSSHIVNEVGREIGGESFLAKDFKKKDGFGRAVEISNKFGLYRQNYCGCRYSILKEGEKS